MFSYRLAQVNGRAGSGGSQPPLVLQFNFEAIPKNIKLSYSIITT